MEKGCQSKTMATVSEKVCPPPQTRTVSISQTLHIAFWERVKLRIKHAKEVVVEVEEKKRKEKGALQDQWKKRADLPG